MAAHSSSAPAQARNASPGRPLDSDVRPRRLRLANGLFPETSDAEFKVLRVGWAKEPKGGQVAGVLGNNRGLRRPTLLRAFDGRRFQTKGGAFFIERRELGGYGFSQDTRKNRPTIVRVFPGGNNPLNNQDNNNNPWPSVVFLLVFGGLTLTGQLNWLYEGIFGFISSLIVFVVIVNIAAIIASWVFEKNILMKQTVGTCPSCGNEIKIYDAFANDQLGCPNCFQPFRVVDGKFVRDQPQFTKNYNDPFFGSNRKNTKPSYDDVIDVEAKVMDKD